MNGYIDETLIGKWGAQLTNHLVPVPIVVPVVRPILPLFRRNISKPIIITSVNLHWVRNIAVAYQTPSIHHYPNIHDCARKIETSSPLKKIGGGGAVSHYPNTQSNKNSLSSQHVVGHLVCRQGCSTLGNRSGGVGTLAQADFAKRGGGGGPSALGVYGREPPTPSGVSF